MTAKAVQILIQTVGLILTKDGLQTTEQMPSLLNLVNGLIQIMMDLETTSMASNQITALTEGVTQT